MKPTAAPKHFPYHNHRTMADVMREERAKEIMSECSFTRKQVAA